MCVAICHCFHAASICIRMLVGYLCFSFRRGLVRTLPMLCSALIYSKLEPPFVDEGPDKGALKINVFIPFVGHKFACHIHAPPDYHMSRDECGGLHIIQEVKVLV